jgi:blocked-early-in-transport protein 1
MHSLTQPFSRFGSSNLHQRDPRSALFEGYTGGSGSDRPTASPSPSRGYGYGLPPASGGSHLGVDSSSRGFRPATPNSRGQYSGAVLDELESQNDAQVEGILGKVKVLKDVSRARSDSSYGEEVAVLGL